MKPFRYMTALYLDRNGMNHLKKRQFKEAISKFMRAEKIFEEIGDRTDKGKQSGNLAMAYRGLAITQNDIRCLDKGIEYGEEALKISREVNDKVMEANALSDLGNLYSIRIDKSKPASIAGTEDNSVLQLSTDGIQHFFSDAIRAIECLEEAADAFRKLDNQAMTGNSLFMLAVTLAKTGHNDRALTVAHEAAGVLAKANSPLLRNVNDFLMMAEGYNSVKRSPMK
jgi:tetratricopeptide (TPR) repeat protein